MYVDGYLLHINDDGVAELDNPSNAESTNFVTDFL